MAPSGQVLPRAPVVCLMRGGGGSTTRIRGFKILENFEPLLSANRRSCAAPSETSEGHISRSSRLPSYTSHARAPTQNLAPDHWQSRIPTRSLFYLTHPCEQTWARRSNSGCGLSRPRPSKIILRTRCSLAPISRKTSDL